jgi:uncharacterized FlaG/YvyC family protein
METFKKTDVKINAVSEDQASKDRRKKYLQNVSDSKKNAAEEKAKQDKKQKNINRACKDLKIELNTLNSGLRIFHIDENGQKKFVSDSDRDIKNTQLSAAYNKNCQSYQKTLD